MESIIQNAISRQLGTIEQPTEKSTEPTSGETHQQPTEQQNQNNGLEQFAHANDAKILVLGIGGMGNNAVNRLYNMGIHGADTIGVNTDSQHLKSISCDKKILLGEELTKGLGAGGYPNTGKKAAEESITKLRDTLKGADMIFLVAGMGGGTGTGAAPIIAEIGHSQGAIVVGVVTMPFKIEGTRIQKAEEGLSDLRQKCDTVIVIENDKLLEIAGQMPLEQAFAVADEIIVTMIKGITETISMPSIVNLDYADVKTIMKSGGVAMIGVGEASSTSRAREAVEKAMSNPLLDVDYKGALGALIHIAGGHDLKLDEINEIGEYVSKHLDPGAQIIWGARIDENMDGKLRVITIITGVQSQYILGPQQEDIAKAHDLSEALGVEIIKK